MTGPFPPLPRPPSLPPSPPLCLTCCHPLMYVLSLFPRSLCSMTAFCRPTLERDTGKFTNSAPACPGRQKLGILIERCILLHVLRHTLHFNSLNFDPVK